MKKWSSLCFLFSTFLMTSLAQYNPYQQRGPYGNYNMNTNLQAQQQQQPNRQFSGANTNQR